VPAIGGGSARSRGGGGGGHRSKISLPSHPKNTKKAKKGGFAHVWAEKSPKTLFFAQKYFIRYTHEMFFEEYINFKIVHYLSHCRVILV
jgi:hypothetical protein